MRVTSGERKCERNEGGLVSQIHFANRIVLQMHGRVSPDYCKRLCSGISTIAELLRRHRRTSLPFPDIRFPLVKSASGFLRGIRAAQENFDGRRLFRVIIKGHEKAYAALKKEL